MSIMPNRSPCCNAVSAIVMAKIPWRKQKVKTDIPEPLKPAFYVRTPDSQKNFRFVLGEDIVSQKWHSDTDFESSTFCFSLNAEEFGYIQICLIKVREFQNSVDPLTFLNSCQLQIQNFSGKWLPFADIPCAYALVHSISNEKLLQCYLLCLHFVLNKLHCKITLK
mmetsp:Transcript_4615/g.7303  ORF Transcript_4615/g.7303 Transcript_4615/m.7303 type:complete len:166 (+) Transcript_4615:230-727(+)